MKGINYENYSSSSKYMYIFSGFCTVNLNGVVDGKTLVMTTYNNLFMYKTQVSDCVIGGMRNGVKLVQVYCICCIPKSMFGVNCQSN